MKFDYGETYGNHTTKYFQDFRSSTLDSSKTNYCKGGYFPTYFTYNPDLAIGHRTRQWDRWLHEPRYTVTPHDHDRKEELIRFDRVRFVRIIFIMSMSLYCHEFVNSCQKVIVNTTTIKVEQYKESTTSCYLLKPKTSLKRTCLCK